MAGKPLSAGARGKMGMSLESFMESVEEHGVRQFAEKVVKGKKTVFDKLARM
ncbi:MAG: hypothetical protein JRN43_07005 [Nitrososphaerota archaeon]|nr:hypothetical protein [Nitrososphaerota archaeon]MDG7020054.1 hypothetical protein [Nitrososphaerota archaeon]